MFYSYRIWIYKDCDSGIYPVGIDFIGISGLRIMAFRIEISGFYPIEINFIEISG